MKVLLSLSIYFLHTSTGSLTLSSDHRKAFVDGHNTKRAKLIAGTIPNYPKAASMETISWDTSIETFAKGHADKCTGKHSTSDERKFGTPSIYHGENLASGASTGALDPNKQIE